MKAVDLLKEKDIPVRFPVAVAPMVPDMWGNYGPYTLEKNPVMVLTATRLVGQKNITLLYQPLDSPYKKTIVVKDSFRLVGVRGKKKLEIIDTFKEIMMKNLSQHLIYTGHIGSDPEIFVEDKDNNIIPAFEFLGSKKEKKNLTIENLPVYWDGFQAEFETVPNTCLSYHVDSIRAGLLKVWKDAKVRNSQARLSTKTVFEVPFQLIANAKNEHVEFGCMPSLNAYGMFGLKIDGRDTNIRSAGGHIHFGIGKQEDAVVEREVKALDAILGVACVSMFAKWDNPARRTMYGLAGEYRLPPHGMEYRVLSNAWMFHPVITNLVFDLSRKALIFGQKNLLSYWKASEEETISIINNCDVEKAREVLNRNKDLLIQLFVACYSNTSYAKKAYDIFFEGMESVIKDPTDLITNWSLDKRWVNHNGNANSYYQNACPTLLKGIKV